MPKKKTLHLTAAASRVVQIVDQTHEFRCTGLLLNSQGWVLTCGHVFADLFPDGINVNQQLPWHIRTEEGLFHNFAFVRDKIHDEKTLIDFALIKTECNKRIYPDLIPRREVDAHESVFMRGFAADESRISLHIAGKIIGPTRVIAGGPPLVQLFWENQGDYVGFSGAPIFIYNNRIGVKLAAVQKGQYGALHVQIGIPCETIDQTISKGHTPEQPGQFYGLFSHTTVAVEARRVLLSRYFVPSNVHVLGLDASTPDEEEDIAEVIVRRIQWHVPHLAGQISNAALIKHLRLRQTNLSNSRKRRNAADDTLQAIAMSVRRPKTQPTRTNLAKHFGRQRWARNMYRAMTAKELEQLSDLKDFVVVFLFY